MILLNRKVLILLLCTIGCSVHLVYVVSEFLKFPVRTDITYDHPKMLAVPEIDIFLNNIDLMNLTQLYIKYPEKIRLVCSYFLGIEIKTNFDERLKANCSKFLRSYNENSYYIGKMLTVGDVEKLDAEPLIHQYKINEYVRNDLCSVKKYFNALHTFIRISCRNDSKPIERRVVQNIVIDDRFCITHKIYNRFGVRFAHINSSIIPVDLNYIEVEREKNENIFTHLRYKETIVINSEWPYETNCRHYEKSQVFSQCLREKTSHLYPGMIQLEDVLEVGQFPSHFKFADLAYENQTHIQLRRECAEKVKQLQCTTKTYQTVGRSSREKGTGIGLICLESQIDLRIVVKTYPKSTFTELLIYISSILGIWFGISIYGKLMNGFIFPNPQHLIKKVTPNEERSDNQ